MKTPIPRRDFLKASALAAGTGMTAPYWMSRALAADVSPAAKFPYSIARGPFQPNWESLEQNYHLPDWYRDAKFGIWAHWGPQCQPRQSDWYAKYMYDQGRPQYQFHVEHYGHPSKFGFKDVIHEWKADKWDPATLIQRYKRAGARFFVSMANHHDNIDMFDSKFQPWNSVRVGSQKDIVGTWAKLARKAGLPFGVSVHSARAWNWYEDAQGSDKTGPLTGVRGIGPDYTAKDIRFTTKGDIPCMRSPWAGPRMARLRSRHLRPIPFIIPVRFGVFNGWVRRRNWPFPRTKTESPSPFPEPERQITQPR